MEGPRPIFLNIGKTLANTIAGFLISLGLTLIAIALYHLNDHLAAFVEALNTFIQSVSALIWTLIFLLIFGLTSILPPISVVAATSFPILLTLSLNGSKVVLEKYGDIAKVMRAQKLQLIKYFVMPGIVPYIASGSRAAVGNSLRISVVAEALGSSGGVGYMLVYCYNLGYKGGVFAWSLVLIALMMLVDGIVLRPLERWARNWMS
ncbi:MAG: ABC transporter permease subunit [Desulfurococcales archaeon]|jgi:NitT/TauT family transport system permease protein|uniref:ABC transporter permease subunit n=1 Tax=Fervidicoccus fontis TaxID=683846 RepID=A0A7J3SJU1_9CREN|nr:ABC transporter permease subunit [Thermoprotei archaeon]NAY89514.1 ABC transporter permease subunit [Desulfurococcales archaeon]